MKYVLTCKELNFNETYYSKGAIENYLLNERKHKKNHGRKYELLVYIPDYKTNEIHILPAILTL